MGRKKTGVLGYGGGLAIMSKKGKNQDILLKERKKTTTTKSGVN